MNRELAQGVARLSFVAAGLLLSAQACGSSKKAVSTQDAGNTDTNEASGGSSSNSADIGGSLVSNVPCSQDGECASLNMVCDTFINYCVKCTGSSCNATSPLDSGSCATSGGNPCATIAHFTGTQTLDAKGDEFCSIPPFQLDSSNAAKVVTLNAAPQEVLTARIGWSTAGLHAYIEVQDSSVQVVDTVDTTQSIDHAYQGDSIEVMLASSNDVTGLTGSDTNSLHVIVPASGPAISSTASNDNGSSQGTAKELPTSQYVQTNTNAGYAVELQLPWPGGAAPAPGSNIRFDLALNSADSTFGDVADMRDGQLIYHLETVTDTTCQGTADGAEPYCDNRTWCTTTAEP